MATLEQMGEPTPPKMGGPTFTKQQDTPDLSQESHHVPPLLDEEEHDEAARATHFRRAFAALARNQRKRQDTEVADMCSTLSRMGVAFDGWRTSSSKHAAEGSTTRRPASSSRRRKTPNRQRRVLKVEGSGRIQTRPSPAPSAANLEAREARAETAAEILQRLNETVKSIRGRTPRGAHGSNIRNSLGDRSSRTTFTAVGAAHNRRSRYTVGQVAGAKPPSCLRASWPLRSAATTDYSQDKPYQQWRKVLKRDRVANCQARADDWSYRAADLAETKLMTPSRILPWHVDDGSESSQRLAASIAAIAARATHTEATTAMGVGDERLGRAVAGWTSFEDTRAKALSYHGLELVLNE